MRRHQWQLGLGRACATCNHLSSRTRPPYCQLSPDLTLKYVSPYSIDALPSKSMSSSAATGAARAMEVGQIVSGAPRDYRLHRLLDCGVHQSKIFKAEILSKDEDESSTRWAVVKAASSNQASLVSLKREHDIYNMHNVASKSCFRALYDVIGKDHIAGAGVDALVFEWMDCTLADLPPEKYQCNLVLLKVIIDAVLHSLVALETGKLVNTDIKPDGIMLSHVDTSHPVAKMGDLGLVLPDGFQGPAQPFAMRAPEVYLGLGCTHRSSVWALAATIFCWMRPGVLGSADSQVPFSNEAWCIAKLKRLFPGWVVPSIEDEIRKYEFELADALIEESTSRILKMSTLEKELNVIPTLPEVKDLLRSMLIIDNEQRPTAGEVLRSKEYLALGNEIQK